MDIYRDALNENGIRRLPWNTYDLAILITHSEFLPQGKSYLTTGEGKIRNNQGIRIEIDSLKRVDVYGCHLSGVRGGKLAHTQVVEMVIARLKKLKKKKCCMHPERIQIVSATLSSSVVVYK
jgi:hypothetical protein